VSILIFNGYCVSFFVVEENKEKRKFKQIFPTAVLKRMIMQLINNVSNLLKMSVNTGICLSLNFS
jgi:hypothetical protein